MEKCKYCNEKDPKHQDEHAGYCCDCFDLSVGCPIRVINCERAKDGKPPLVTTIADINEDL